MKPLVIIPARGGSKGIPNKNIKKLNNKPLIYYTIEQAREIFKDELICVSTDDIEIKKSVEKIGLKVPFLRPKELATDTSGTHEVLLHAIDFYEKKGYKTDTIILLQPTSPFRKPIHIKEALLLYTTNLEMIASVKESKANPYFNLFEEDKDEFIRKSKDSNYVRRQDCPKVWELNGAIYVISVESLKQKPMNKFSRVKKYVMDDLSSHDIDTQFDWSLAEVIKNREIIKY